MPLPAILQARLLKRGIIRKKTEPEPEEEIIAEDYDDHTSTLVEEEKPEEVSASIEPKKVIHKENIKPAPGCPNKWNIHHSCSEFCITRWGDGIKTPDIKDEKKRMKMMKKFPLSDDWEEIYDPGTGRYYYWNVVNDEVAWLPPLHPKFKASLPAAILREMLRKEEEELRKKVEEEEEAELKAQEGKEKKSHVESRHERKRERDRDRDRDRERDRERERDRDRERERERSKGRPKHKENELDPMDPAAYSDTPRGNWSSGLERKGEAKTGADTTASGPLYQMRPYPSPGAVLRANAEMQAKDKK